MTDYYVAALGPNHAKDVYICFRCPMRSDSVCWPLPWAGTWSETDVVEAAAELNDGVETIAVPTDVVHALATAPSPGKIEGDVGPVVRNSASNRRALVVAARQNLARLEAFKIPRAVDATQGDEDILKALGTLLPLLGRAENVENDRLWRLRADLLALLHSDDRRRGERTVQTVNEVTGNVEATFSTTRMPERPNHPQQEPGQAAIAILRLTPPPAPPPPPSPDKEVNARVVKS